METESENASAAPEGTGEQDAAQGQSESDGAAQDGSEKPVYTESDGTFSTDANGNPIYTDAAGNVTPNVDGYNYTDENGGIITDGYGYIDPYTGAYILNNQ